MLNGIIQRSNNFAFPLQEIRPGQVCRDGVVGDEGTVQHQVGLPPDLYGVSRWQQW